MKGQGHRQLILETVETLLEVQLIGVRQLLDGDHEAPPQPLRRRGSRRTSLVASAVDILTSEQRPVHVDELVELIKQRHARVTDRDSLSSALAKKAKQGVLVRRVSPATFTLLEDG